MTEQQPAPSGWEFRLSPDRLDFAVYDPDKGRWFVPNAPMRGQWVDRMDMDRMGWTRYEPATVPSAPAARAALPAIGVFATLVRQRAEHTEAALARMRDRLEVTHIRVRKLHAPDGNGECRSCQHSCPCPTVQVLDGDLRRMADEAQQPETQARRGDGFEAWLKAQRDAAADYPEAHQAADGLLDLYRLHADTGTPLGEHVCEGQAVGDCDCLEPPAPLRRTGDDCPGFPEHCPKILPVDPNPPIHYRGIRCGCADKERPS
jgi:hypothetical protein